MKLINFAACESVNYVSIYMQSLMYVNNISV